MNEQESLHQHTVQFKTKFKNGYNRGANISWIANKTGDTSEILIIISLRDVVMTKTYNEENRLLQFTGKDPKILDHEQTNIDHYLLD